MGIENKDLIVQDQQSGSSETKDTLLNQEQVSPQTETQKLFAEPQTPEQTPFQKEQEKLKLLFEKAKNQIPLLDSPQVRELLSKLETQDPFLTSAFLTDFLASDKANFPYTSDEKLGPLGQKKRYGNRGNFADEYQKLVVITSPEAFKHQFSKCFDMWRSAWTEHKRGSENDKRVKIKRDQFIKEVLFRFPEQDAQMLQQVAKKKRAEQGTLTFEVFLDDLAKRPELFQRAAQPFDELYAEREAWKIEEIGEKTKDIQSFEKILELSSSNNEALKAKAQLRIEKQVWRKGLNQEELAKKIETIYNEELQLAKESYGMLNREELIKTLFVGLKPQDYKSGGLFFKKIQIVGKHYYQFDKIRVDGLWGPETQSVLLSLRSNPKFHAEHAQIDRVLAANRDFGATAKRRAQQLIENYKPGIFDQAFKKNEQTRQSEEQQGKAKKTEQGTQTAVDRNKHLDTSLNEITQDQLETTIPREEYLEALQNFIKLQEGLPHELASNPRLAEQLLDGTGSGEDYDQLKQLREHSQSKQDFLIIQKHELQETIKKTIIERAKDSRDYFFKQMGLPLSYDANLSRAYENRYGKPASTYSVFTDENNPDDHYIFNHSSGYLSARKTIQINPQSKEINLDADNYGIILKFPTAEEQISQAIDVSSYLPYLRPHTKQELTADLRESIARKITHSAGAIERELISSNIETNRLQSSILKHAKHIFQLKDNGQQLVFQTQRAQYELLTPLLNTLNTAKSAELKKLDRFLTLLDQAFELHKGSQTGAPSQSNEHQLLKYLANPVMQKKFTEEGYLKPKTEFGLGMLFHALEKPLEGKTNELENRILDFNKLSFLLEKREKNTDPNNNPLNSKEERRYQQLNSQINNNYVAIAEKQQTEQDLNAMKEIETKLNIAYTTPFYS